MKAALSGKMATTRWVFTKLLAKVAMLRREINVSHPL